MTTENREAHRLSYRFQPMTVQEIFAHSMHLYQENFLKMVAIATPGAVLGGLIFQSVWIYRYIEVESTQIVEAALLCVSIIAFQSAVVTAAGTIAISAYLLGQSINVSQTYTRVLSSLFPLVGATVLFTVAVSVGLMMFILGLIVYAWLCLIAPVVMIEGEGGIGALKRSRVIVKGHSSKAIVIVVLLTVLQAFVAVLLLLIPRHIGLPPAVTFLFSPLSICLPLLIEPIKIVSTTILYYDLRVRKEGYNLQIMAQELAVNSS